MKTIFYNGEYWKLHNNGFIERPGSVAPHELASGWGGGAQQLWNHCSSIQSQRSVESKHFVVSQEWKAASIHS
jgi:hypothetical protein